MADLTIPPLLNHSPEPSPPGRWRIVVFAAIMAVLGILIASAAAIAGQDTRRDKETLENQKNVLTAEYRLAEARLAFADPETLTGLEVAVEHARAAGVSSFARYGREFTNWDGVRYEEIAQGGYVYHQPTDSWKVQNALAILKPGNSEPSRKNVVWYPLYPILGWSLSHLLGISINAALTVISQVSIVLASMILFLYARRHFYNRMPRLHLVADAQTQAEAHPSRRWDLMPEDSAALWAVAALLFGPCSIFLYANYTESLFVLLLCAFLYCLQGRWWWRAAMVAAIASACRSQGALFGPILAVVFILRSDVRNPAAKLGIAAALGCVSAIGVGCYMIYLNMAFGDPLAFVHAQAPWHVGINFITLFHALNPVNPVANIVNHAFYTSPMDWPTLWEAFCVIWPPIMLLVLGGRFLSFELEMVGWLLWGLPFISNSLAGSDWGTHQWMSMGRFMAVLIPAHIIIGAVLVRFRWLGIPFLATSAAAFALFAFKFGVGQWIG